MDGNPSVLIGQIKSMTDRSSCLHPVLVSAPGPVTCPGLWLVRWSESWPLIGHWPGVMTQ